MDDAVYLLLDPVNKFNSGITSYVDSAATVLKNAGVQVAVLSIESGESISLFRERVSLYCNQNSVTIVEAPETYGAANLVPDHVCVHVRLHFSKYIGQIIERKLPDHKIWDDENKSLERAKYISAPSYVAEVLTRKYFRFKCCSVFANPLVNRQFDFLPLDRKAIGFVGRYHLLKGIAFLKKVIFSLPDVNFVIASCELAISELGGLDNVELVGARNAQLVYQKCKVVLVPSYFETVSMVALEALDSGCSVVCWDHIGVAEYFDNPFVYTAPAFDLDLFLSMTITALGESQHDSDRCRRFVNESYVRGVVSLLGGACEYVDPGISCNTTSSELDIIFNRLDYILIKSKKNNVFYRKLRKLIRSPRQFFLDFYRKRKGLIVVSDDRGVSLKPTVDEFAESWCFYMNDYQDYSIPDISSKNCDIRTMVLFDVNCENAEFVVDELDKFQDFWKLRRKNIKLGRVDFSKDWNCFELLKSIPPTLRFKLSSFRCIVLWECKNSALIDFLRSCDPCLIIIGVYENPSEIDLEVVYDHLDVVVTDAMHPISCRKIYCCESVMFPLLLRKVIQESIVSPGGYLVPVFNGLYFFPELEYVDTGFYSGLLILQPNVSAPDFHTQDDYFFWLAKNIQHVYVTDQVYYRYKTLVEKIYDEGVLLVFLRYYLMDGFLFDVR